MNYKLIKVQEKDGKPCYMGRELLYRVAAERVDVRRLFDSDVVEYLAEKSGGVLRDFVRLLAYTIELSQGNTVPLVAWPSPASTATRRMPWASSDSIRSRRTAFSVSQVR